MNVKTELTYTNRGLKRSLLGATGCLLLMALAYGCGGDDSDSTTAAAGTGGQSASGTSTGTGGSGGEGEGAVTVGTGGAAGTGGAGDTGGAGGTGGGTGGTGGGTAEEATPIIIPISDTGHDRFFGVAFDPQGNIYATGVTSSSTEATADYAMIVARFLPTGQLDPSFGTNGVATHNVAVGTNGEVARGIVVQSTGKVVIAGAVEHAGATDARDRDIAAVRFNTDGTLDKTFGTEGVAILDLSEGEVVGNSYVADSQWGLSLFSDDALLITGAQKAPGRTDTDFAVVRLNADGAFDAGFGTNGVATLDINQQGASPRTGTILPDGSVVMAGYTRDADDIVSPVLFKLTSKGELDPSFGVGGVFNQIVLPSVTETYGAALQGTSFVTAGYGRSTPAESLDWISLRITSNGTLDTTYGTDGVARVDVAGFSDNARGLVTLPDNRVMLIGGGRPTTENADAMIGILTPDGKPDTTFAAPGYKLYDMGGAGDFFWGIALSPSQKLAAIVGVKGVGMAAGNDDAALLLLPVGN